VLTGLDWRLIAAVAYQESQWDPNATSYTNVRGIMMLTEETADRLQVSNRLDANESILAGARYINLLKDLLPRRPRNPTVPGSPSPPTTSAPAISTPHAPWPGNSRPTPTPGTK
jgi:hypothetical protein